MNIIDWPPLFQALLLQSVICASDGAVIFTLLLGEGWPYFKPGLSSSLQLLALLTMLVAALGWVLLMLWDLVIYKSGQVLGARRERLGSKVLAVSIIYYGVSRGAIAIMFGITEPIVLFSLLFGPLVAVMSLPRRSVAIGMLYMLCSLVLVVSVSTLFDLPYVQMWRHSVNASVEFEADVLREMWIVMPYGALVAVMLYVTFRGRVSREQALTAASRIDSLTGIANREEILRVTRSRLRRARLQSSRVAVLLCDLDHFKSVNDTYGHQVGDAALKVAVQAMIECTPDVGRVGGEEFLIVVSSDSNSVIDVDALFKRISARMQQLAAEKLPCSLTMSVGVALCPDHGVGVSTLLRLADEGLYESKAGGRSCMTVASIEMPNAGAGGSPVVPWGACAASHVWPSSAPPVSDTPSSQIDALRSARLQRGARYSSTRPQKKTPHSLTSTGVEGFVSRVLFSRASPRRELRSFI